MPFGCSHLSRAWSTEVTIVSRRTRPLPRASTRRRSRRPSRAARASAHPPAQRRHHVLEQVRLHAAARRAAPSAPTQYTFFAPACDRDAPSGRSCLPAPVTSSRCPCRSDGARRKSILIACVVTRHSLVIVKHADVVVERAVLAAVRVGRDRDGAVLVEFSGNCRQRRRELDLPRGTEVDRTVLPVHHPGRCDEAARRWYRCDVVRACRLAVCRLRRRRRRRRSDCLIDRGWTPTPPVPGRSGHALGDESPYASCPGGADPR